MPPRRAPAPGASKTGWTMLTSDVRPEGQPYIARITTATTAAMITTPAPR
jgi:hypothetical protein